VSIDIKKLVEENALLKQEYLKVLNEKEKLVLLCDELNTEREFIIERHSNLKSSKLGRLQVWFWKRRSGKRGNKRS